MATHRSDQAGFTAQERAAMTERATELRTAAARRGKNTKAEDEKGVLEKIAELEASDRLIAERFHEIVRTAAPHLDPKLWYGMPAYAVHGKVVCFFQGAKKFTTRYSTVGFTDAAQLDDGAMWPTAFAVTELTPAVEERLGELVRRAAG
ncbi:MAG TPA: DUF1801 domain-containing protein [Gryllotalpicola sp.]